MPRGEEFAKCKEGAKAPDLEGTVGGWEEKPALKSWTRVGVLLRARAHLDSYFYV